MSSLYTSTEGTEYALSHLSCSELAKLGVTLAGHQKKILSSVQSLQTQGTHVQV